MKNHKSQITNYKSNGFTLVELMVVVAIIAIMSVAGVVGFKYMGDTMRTKEVAGVITDTVKKAELEILKNDYKKSTIHFLQNYLVIVSEPETASLNLDYGSGCLTTTESGSQNLIKEDGEGSLLEAITVPPIDLSVCNGFDTATETEWRYQLRTGGKVSAVVRFIHFNLNRVEPSEITLSADTSQTLVIEAPYAKKTVTGSDSTVSLTLTSPEGHTETLTIQ